MNMWGVGAAASATERAKWLRGTDFLERHPTDGEGGGPPTRDYRADRLATRLTTAPAENNPAPIDCCRPASANSPAWRASWRPVHGQGPVPSLQVTHKLPYGSSILEYATYDQRQGPRSWSRR